jgi:SPP1 gp7 family putative phage head morphogenesis protein
MAAKFGAPRDVDRMFRSKLNAVARAAASIIMPHVNGVTIVNERDMVKAVAAYSKSLEPWAQRLAANTIELVSKSDLAAWRAKSAKIGNVLSDGYAKNAAGMIAKSLQSDQVELIKSIPLEAAKRAQELSREALTNSSRASELADMLAMTESVTVSRATLIARTEIAKANATLTEARATLAGIDQYTWRTMQDGDVRESHAELEGVVFDFNNPPNIDGEGEHGPGEFPNCRCYPEPLII